MHSQIAFKETKEIDMRKPQETQRGVGFVNGIFLTSSKEKKKCTSEHHIETDITRNVMTKAHGGSLQPPYFLQSLIFCLISICWLRQLWGTRGKWGCHMTWVTGRESLGIWERAREREMGRLLCAVKRHVVGRTKSSLIQRKNEEWRRWNRETSRERQ